MGKLWIDQPAIQAKLSHYFEDNRKVLTMFGGTVNQTFEAHVFAALIERYRRAGWQIEFVHPSDNAALKGLVRLKFSTRGRPDNYTYVVCRKDGLEVQIRHQLRVSTYFFQDGDKPANVCLDVAVVEAGDYSGFKSDDSIPNTRLLTFGEAKHMSAFAELVAQFVGLVHEMKPDNVTEGAWGPLSDEHLVHPHPFLFVSGFFLRTAEGVIATIERRKYAMMFFNYETKFFGMTLATKGRPPTTAT